MKRIATPMVGGLVSSTILTLIVIPAVYALVQRVHLQPGDEAPAGDSQPDAITVPEPATTS